MPGDLVLLAIDGYSFLLKSFFNLGLMVTTGGIIWNNTCADNIICNERFEEDIENTYSAGVGLVSGSAMAMIISSCAQIGIKKLKERREKKKQQRVPIENTSTGNTEVTI